MRIQGRNGRTLVFDGFSVRNVILKENLDEGTTMYLFVYLEIKYRRPPTDVRVFISKLVHPAGPPFASRVFRHFV
jgi:hypothetical protein